MLFSKKQVSDFLVIQRSSDVRAVHEKQMNISVLYQLLPSQYIPRHKRYSIPAALSDYVSSCFVKCDETMPMEKENQKGCTGAGFFVCYSLLGSDI